MNCLLVLSLHDVIRIILSADPSAFQCVLDNNKKFSEIFCSIKNQLREKLELNYSSEIKDISDAALFQILINEGFYQYNEASKVSPGYCKLATSL